jgi:hypothetical protein
MGAAALLSACLFGVCGCDRSGSSASQPSGGTSAVEPPVELPEHRFAEGLSTQYPEVVSFLRTSCKRA